MSVCGCEVVRGAAAPKRPMTYAVFIAFREHIHFCYEGGEVMKEKDLSFGVGARI